MLQYSRAREALSAARGSLSAADYAKAATRLCQSLPEDLPVLINSFQNTPQSEPAAGSIPLCILGGPLSLEDLSILQAIEAHGGRIVLDATDSGERARPAPFDSAAMNKDPLAELARAYFAAIPDAFRRPDSLLYQWLAEKLAQRRPKGIVLIRQVWCDLWHAEVQRVREAFDLPLLDLPVSGSPGAAASLATRIQSFLEILQ